MNRKRYIWLIMLLLGIIPEMQAQYLDRLCAGDTGVIYKVKGNEGSTFNWKVEGGSIVSDYGDSIKVNWGNQPGEYDISVQEFSRHGCPAVPKTARILINAPSLNLGADLEICEGESVEIDAGNAFSSYQWQDGSTQQIFTASDEGYVSLTVTDENGCKRSDSIYLSVHPLPFVDIGPDSSLCGDDEYILDAGMEGVQYTWSTGSSSQSFTAREGMGTIWVQVMNEYDCVAYDSMLVLPCYIDDVFKDMPTAFTPNADGTNDTWIIPELQNYPEAVVEIYDRWGNLLFKSEPGYPDPWDGISFDGRVMPMDSYYFIINLGTSLGEQVSGNVTIIK